MPVRVSNISEKSVIIKPQTTLCELQQVKVLRNVYIAETHDRNKSANIASQINTKGEETATFLEGVKLLNTEENEKVTELFHRW